MNRLSRWLKCVKVTLRNPHLAEEYEQAVAAMVTAQEKLRTQIRNTMEYEKRLNALGRLSSLLVHALEMEPFLHSAISVVMEVMGVEVVLIFSLEEKTGKLMLMAYEGVPWGFAQAVDGMKLGEGFNGRVAKTGEPLLVEDASQDNRLTREAVRQENLQFQLIVPMKSRDRIVGTICVAMRRHRELPTTEEIELLTGISNAIGAAIENVHLYQERLSIMERLHQSETHYRELFESAHDAIWVHDLEGNILSANKAGEEATGFSMGELHNMNVKDFLSQEALLLAGEVRNRLLQHQVTMQPYEQKMIRRDGTEAILMLTTNLVTTDGQSIAFQNIARDVTEEKRMQENLRSYVQQITRAQEEEHLRIARELHDSTAQNLIALLHQLENLLHNEAKLPVSVTRPLWAFHEQVKAILQEVRHLSRDLRPSILDDVGLLPALRWAVRELETEHGIKASLQVRGTEQKFSQEGELIFFRIAQEALRNIGKHSYASNTEVLIKFEEGKTTVIIRDDGIGFQLPEKISDLSRSGKLGLVGIEERARLLGGSLEVKSEPGKGTSVIVEAPM